VLKPKKQGGFIMTACTTKTIEYSRYKRRKVQAKFNGDDICGSRKFKAQTGIIVRVSTATSSRQ
jgi:hypothetical protein